MNTMSRFARKLADMEPIDILLADVVVRIQLAPSEYRRAVQRADTLADWLDRPDSPLRGRVRLVYPQGSMAINATVARHSERAEHDIDLMAELDLWAGATPREVLDLLYKAIRGERGSRYWDMTERRTRCITITYADGMHLDITPAERRPLTIDRESDIFHSKPEDPREPEQRIAANPHAFATWFDSQTPADDAFGLFFEQRTLDEERMLLAEVATEPVPDQEPAYRKSKALIALQLLKRWRNIVYDRRPGQRRPPSVLLTWSVARNANRTSALVEELTWQANALLDLLAEADGRRQLISVVNPKCRDDVLTDRWPATLADQRQFMGDLREFIREMATLKAAAAQQQMLPVLERLFGERPARDAVAGYFKRAGDQMRSGKGLVLPSGRIPVAATGLAAGATGAQAAPKHTFYGEE